MDVKDFLPKYPNIEKSKYEVLNPYDDNFYEAIFRKKEFYENRLEKVEQFPREKGMLTKHQKTIARYVSGHTPYDALLLVHSMGTGKTCSAVGAIEQIKSEHPIVGDVRAKGCLMGIELVKDRRTKEPLDEAGRLVYQKAFAKGLAWIPAGHILRMSPPIVMEDEVLIKGLDMIDEAIGETEKELC